MAFRKGLRKPKPTIHRGFVEDLVKNKKINLALGQVTKAQRGSRRIAPLFL